MVETSTAFYIDQQGNVWVGGTTKDHQLIKFTPEENS